MKKGDVTMFGIFGNLFDFNHNGRIDVSEQAAEIAIFNQITCHDNNNFSIEEIDDFNTINK